MRGRKTPGGGGERRQGADTSILDLLGILIEWGKKAGKQVIRSTGLSIEVGVGGT